MNRIKRFLYKNSLITFSSKTFRKWEKAGLSENLIFVAENSLFPIRNEVINHLINLASIKSVRLVLFRFVDDPIKTISIKVIHYLKSQPLDSSEEKYIDEKLKFWKEKDEIERKRIKKNLRRKKTYKNIPKDFHRTRFYDDFSPQRNQTNGFMDNGMFDF